MSWELQNKKGENPKNYTFTSPEDALAFLKKLKAKVKEAKKKKQPNYEALREEAVDLRIVEVKDA